MGRYDKYKELVQEEQRFREDSKWKKETVTNGTEVKLKGIDEFDIVMHNEQYNLDLTLYLALEER